MYIYIYIVPSHTGLTFGGPSACSLNQVYIDIDIDRKIAIYMGVCIYIYIYICIYIYISTHTIVHIYKHIDR